MEISLEIQEDETDVIEDQVANLTEQITELKQQVKNIYGDEEDWERMSALLSLWCKIDQPIQLE